MDLTSPGYHACSQASSAGLDNGNYMDKSTGLGPEGLLPKFGWEVESSQIDLWTDINNQLNNRDAVAPPRRPETQTDWDSMKATIKSLYIDSNTPLPKVMDILSQEPYNFEATTKMYKNQFKKWGFEKNLTSKRVMSLLQPIDVSEQAEKTFDAARITRYFKRQKMTTLPTLSEGLIPPDKPDSVMNENNPQAGSITSHSSSRSILLSLQDSTFSSAELNPTPSSSIKVFQDTEVTLPPYSSVDTTVQSSPQSTSGNRCGSKYPQRTERLSTADTVASTITTKAESATSADSCPFATRRGKKFKVIGNPSRERYYQSESWGSHKYHAIDIRKCSPSCPCRDVVDTNYVFVIHRYTFNIDVIVSDPELRAVLQQTGRNLDRSGLKYAGLGLLAHYPDLKRCLTRFRESRQAKDAEFIEKLALFVEGFLEDEEVWEEYNTKELRKTGYVCDSLWDKFQKQKVLRGIQRLDEGFQTAVVTPKPDEPEQITDTCGPTGDTIDKTPNLPAIDETTTVTHVDEPTLVESTAPRKANGPLACKPSATMFKYQLPRQQLFCDDESRAFSEKWLVNASASGELDDVQTLLDSGVNPNCIYKADGYSYSPLMAAVKNGRFDIARLLLIRGGNPNQPRVKLDGNRVTMPLHVAVKNSDRQMVRLLLQHEADIQLLATNRMPNKTTRLTPLQVAIKMEDLNMFRLLLTWNSTYSKGYKSVEVQQREDVSQAAKRARDLIHASITGKMLVTSHLLRNGVGCNVITTEGTALSNAAKYDHMNIVRLLLKHGADVEVAVLYLARTGELETARALTKAAYGEVASFKNLRDRFIRQFNNLRHSSRHSESSLHLLVRQLPSYKQAWASGVKVMKDICLGNVPSSVGDVLAFLITTRSVAETLSCDTGDIEYIDKFEADLVRWQRLFTFEEDIQSYREAINKLWGVRLTEILSYDSDYEHKESMGELKRLIRTLIDGAKMSLNIDDLADEGLCQSIAGWESWKQSQEGRLSGLRVVQTQKATRQPPIYFAPRMTAEIVWDPGTTTTSEPVPPDVYPSQSRAITPQHNPNPNLIAGMFYFYGDTTIVEDLLRGSIFSIVLIFLDGIMSLTVGLPKDFIAIGGIGTISQRLAILRVFLGMVIYADGNCKSTSDSSHSIGFSYAKQVGSTFPKATQWYGILSCGVIM